MENSFRVYLPSNASTHVFPNNKPAEYQVELNPPLTLEGDWQVGVENVCYNSAINDVDETEAITVTAETTSDVLVNDEYHFPYVLTSDGKWNYDWIQLDHYPPYDSYSEPLNIRRALNSGNSKIMKEPSMVIYNFFLNFHTPIYKPLLRCEFKSFSSGFTLRMYRPLLKYLGLSAVDHFNKQYSDVIKDADRSKIKASDMKIKIFDENVIECEKRVMLKLRNEIPCSLTELVKRWNDTIGKIYGEMALATSEKFVIVKKNDKLTFTFSRSLLNTIKHGHAVIGSGEFTGMWRYAARRMTKHEEWWVDIYGDRMKRRKGNFQQRKVSITLSPRQYLTVAALIQAINPRIKQSVKRSLAHMYDERIHSISFSLENQKTVIRLGSNVKCILSENLMRLFGFKQQSFDVSRTVSMESPMTLDKREQRLYIQSDIIAPISVGYHKEYVLRDFIHNSDQTHGLVEKLFEPIHYHPVVKQFIPVMSLKITNGLREVIHLKDTKTLITLVFRKAK